MEVNEDQKVSMIPKILNHFGGNIKGKRIAIWGLSFKPDTDDIREAPALYNIEELLKLGATVKAYDPEGMKNVKKLLGDKIEFATNAYDAVDGADALLIATEWTVFRTPDFEKLNSLMPSKVIFDGRNLYDPIRMAELGYNYFSVGRKNLNS